jgi:cytochrome c peroxidase
LQKGLKQNSFVAITLIWDRWVELNDKNNNQEYDIGETFIDKGLNNLDVYLVKENGKNNGTSGVPSLNNMYVSKSLNTPR